jgi:hypothetical protein
MPDFTKYATRTTHTEPIKPMEGGFDAIKGIQNLMRLFGREVEPALYALLCDTQSDARLTIDKAIKGGAQTATAVLVPMLISQFSIAPAIATMVAAVAVQAIATVGQEKLCHALAPAGRRAGFASAAAVAVAPAPAAPAAYRREADTDIEPEPSARSKGRGKKAVSSIMPRTTVEPRAPAEPPVEAKPAAKVRAKVKARATVKAKVKTKAPARKKTTK